MFRTLKLTTPANEKFACLLTVNNVKTCVQISPVKKHFAYPFKLKLKNKGNDLQEVYMQILDFVHSNRIPAEYDHLSADFSTGTLEVKNAATPYFSALENPGIYGFIGAVY
jgi:hypothetical protein